MKSATIPPLRVTPELRQDAESVLRDGESLSGFVEESLRKQIAHRRFQREFIARGLASREEARDSGGYLSKDELMASLQSALEQTKGRG